MTVKSGTRTGKVKPPAQRATSGRRAPVSPKVPLSKLKKAKVRIFISYCHANAVQQAKLQVHLAQLHRDEIETWFDGRMEAGDKLSAADIFVALMSPEYIASYWCQLEYKRAMGRRAKGSMRVVVVVVRPCAWKDTGVSELKVLPHDGRTVSDWRSMDHAFANAVEGIKGAVKAVRASLAQASPVRPAKSGRSTVAPKAKKPPVTAGGIPKAAAKARSGVGSTNARQSARNRAAR